MEKYKQYTEEQLKLADVVLLVFDVTDKSSFESINSKWISSFETHSTASCVLPFSFFIVYFLAFFILCIHSQLALALNILGSKKQKQNRKE